MLTADVVVIGGGPAGLAAAITAAKAGAQVVLCDRSTAAGGQLVKQTHRFFGSQAEGAGVRGFHLGSDLARQLQELPDAQLMTDTTVLAVYPDGKLLLNTSGTITLCAGKRYVVATGASERGLLFAGNDLPGVYGAGAVQTLMNVYGVIPGQRVLMIGSGNIGLIVSYQLLQAGVEVAAVVEAMPQIGGYLVHAAKIRRAGVPILSGHTIKAATGDGKVEGAIVCQIDDKWQQVPGSEKLITVDTVCLAVGLTPICDLLWQAGCHMAYIPELGGFVPWHDQQQRTSVPHVFVAGDAGGVEEASSAIMTGVVAGAAAAGDLGLNINLCQREMETARSALERLRQGPAGAKIRAGRTALAGLREVAL